MSEQWEDIPNYEGFYQVSDHGRVVRIKPATGTKPGKILRLQTERDGYERIFLYHGSAKSRKRFFVHRLVLLAFVGPLPPNCDVNHIDGNKINNHLSNLEYVTRSKNILHAYRFLDTMPNNAGSRNGQAILTEAQIVEMRNLYATGNYYYRDLSAIYGVNQSAVTNIVNGRTWKHVTGPIHSISGRPLKPTRPGNSKLTPDQVREIRSLYATGDYSQQKLAERFGVSKPVVGNIVTGKGYRDVK